MNESIRSRRVTAPALHLLASLGMIVLAAILVFGIWYPPPYASLAAGLPLFLLLVTVGVVLGPALTAIAADPAKPTSVFHRDLAVIVAVQLAGLAYSIYSIAEARPVYLCFEVDRMRVVTAADIELPMLAKALPEFRELPWAGPRVVAAERPAKPDEVLRSIDLALNGFDISLIPRNWRTYQTQHEAAWGAAHPATTLRDTYPASAQALLSVAAAAGQTVEAVRFLPVVSRQASWVVLIAAPDARIIGFLPLDGFI